MSSFLLRQCGFQVVKLRQTMISPREINLRGSSPQRMGELLSRQYPNWFLRRTVPCVRRSGRISSQRSWHTTDPGYFCQERVPHHVVVLEKVKWPNIAVTGFYSQSAYVGRDSRSLRHRAGKLLRAQTITDHAIPLALRPQNVMVLSAHSTISTQSSIVEIGQTFDSSGFWTSRRSHTPERCRRSGQSHQAVSLHCIFTVDDAFNFHPALMRKKSLRRALVWTRHCRSEGRSRPFPLSFVYQ